MIHRDEFFKLKFESAAASLGVRPDQLVSIKFREYVDSYDEYHRLIEGLREVGVECHEVDGEFQGRGYELHLGSAKSIVVEHETGLEILYIAGSIASLIALVPLIVQSWGALRGRLRRSCSPISDGVEIRRIDQNGHLLEEHLHARQYFRSPSPFGVPDPSGAVVSPLLEHEFKAAAQKVESLAIRVDALEKLLRDREPKAPVKTHRLRPPKVKKAKG